MLRIIYCTGLPECAITIAQFYTATITHTDKRVHAKINILELLLLSMSNFKFPTMCKI